MIQFLIELIAKGQALQSVRHFEIVKWLVEVVAKG